MGAQRREQDVGGTAARRSAGELWADKRPALVTFAAITLFTLGGFHVLLAISEFVNSTWVVGLNSVLFIQSLILWGIIDLIIGFIALYAGFSILRGGLFGWIMGLFFAILGIIGWLFYIPATPPLAVVLIVLDVLVIYGLTRDSDYLQRNLSNPS